MTKKTKPEKQEEKQELTTIRFLVPQDALDSTWELKGKLKYKRLGDLKTDLYLRGLSETIKESINK